MPTNTKKSAILGEPAGTANAKLRKSLLFALAGRLELLNCYRCEEPIEGIEEFSIDHMDAWQGAENPRQTFFDVENIAFSHLICNIKAAGRIKAHATNTDRNHAHWMALDKEYYANRRKFYPSRQPKRSEVAQR